MIFGYFPQKKICIDILILFRFDQLRQDFNLCQLSNDKIFFDSIQIQNIKVLRLRFIKSKNFSKQQNIQNLKRQTKQSGNKIMINPNSTKNQTQKVPSFFLSNSFQNTKSCHTKSTKNLNISLGAHQTGYKFNTNVMENKSMMNINQTKQQKSYKFLQRSYQHGNENDVNRKLASIATQNSRLKEENEFLRRQLQKMRKNPSEKMRIQSSTEKNNSIISSRSQSPPHQPGDLRNTIKKQSPPTKNQVNDTKQMKMKLQILSKQCKMYEQIIDKMQATIRRLTDQNKSLSNNSINFSRSYEKDNNYNKKQQLQSLKEKVNLVMKQYSQLQSKMHSNELQWVIWKQQWITQKNIYLNKIKQLENKLKEKQNTQKKF